VENISPIRNHDIGYTQMEVANFKGSPYVKKILKEFRAIDQGKILLLAPF